MTFFEQALRDGGYEFTAKGLAEMQASGLRVDDKHRDACPARSVGQVLDGMEWLETVLECNEEEIVKNEYVLKSV